MSGILDVTTWRPVLGYEGCYEVSDSGVVRSVERRMLVPVIGRQAVVRFLKPRELKPWKSGAGYLMVALGMAREHRRYVHRIVAAAFHGESDLEVNHKNGDKSDNSARNVEWVTRKANCLHATHVLGKRRGQFAIGGSRIV